MVTNTFLPHVGGVARSVASFADEFRRRGHAVLTIAPHFPNAVEDAHVVRVPAIEHFRKTDFSLPLPLLDKVRKTVADFQPHVIHSHHPFLLGDTALRLGVAYSVPAVFTHHTQYDKYAHYFAGNAPLAEHFIAELAVGYCNLCDAVVAPSTAIADLLRGRGVTTRLAVIPTGVDVTVFAEANGARFRQKLGIPPTAFVVGHVGRLAPEKNLAFLARCVGEFLERRSNAWFVIAGQGPALETIRGVLDNYPIADRVIMLGVLRQGELHDLYAGLDTFVFTSQSETQGIVLAEAMAAGCPVVALAGPGVDDVVKDSINGRRVPTGDVHEFVAAIVWLSDLSTAQRTDLRQAAFSTAREFSITCTADKVLELYASCISEGGRAGRTRIRGWAKMVERVEREFGLWANFAHAIGNALVESVVASKS